MAYVDTNVVIAKYAPRDPLNKDARAFFSYSKTRKVISPISIVELMAVLSRLETELEVPAELRANLGAGRFELSLSSSSETADCR